MAISNSIKSFNGLDGKNITLFFLLVHNPMLSLRIVHIIRLQPSNDYQWVRRRLDKD